MSTPQVNAGAQRAAILKKVQDFPGMPGFVMQVMQQLNDPHADIGVIANKLKFDPGMTANVLRLANSAEFGARRSISSLKDAIVRMGLKQLFQLLVTYGIGQRLSHSMPGYELRPAELLNHSLWAALASEELCHVLKIPTPDMVFTGGLLHDMGKLILDPYLEQAKPEILTPVRERQMPFDEAEQMVLGITHAEVGAALLDQWHFPGALVACARCHHHPDQAGEFQPAASIVHIAEFLAYAQGVGSGVDGFGYRLCDAAIQYLGLNKKVLELVASHTLDKVRELEKILVQ